jgi:hypothetical protein
MWHGSEATLVGVRSWGIMGVDDIEDGVRFDRVYVVNLVIFPCFTVYVESLYCIHKLTFSGCVLYVHYFIDRPHGVVII